jgi:hypothetical protein
MILQFMFLNWCTALGISATSDGNFFFGDVSAVMFHSQNVECDEWSVFESLMVELLYFN